MPSLPATVQWRQVQSVSLITIPFYFKYLQEKCRKMCPASWDPEVGDVSEHWLETNLQIPVLG